MRRLGASSPDLKRQRRQAILSVAAVAAYHAKLTRSPVRLLVCEYAPSSTRSRQS